MRDLLKARELNPGRTNHTMKRAKIVAAKVWKTDSVINCRKITFLLAPVAFLMPISTDRSDALATEQGGVI